MERLRKSQTNRVIAGVCGGLGEYFDLDPTLVRLVFVLLAFLQGFGIIAYVVLWIVTPEQTSVEQVPREVVRENLGRLRDEAERLGTRLRGTLDEPAATTEEPAAYTGRRTHSDRQALAGGILVLVGLILLVENMGLLWWFNLGRLWPLALIAIGAYLLYQRGRERG